MTYQIYDSICDPRVLTADPSTETIFDRQDPFEGVDPRTFPRRWCIIGGGVAGLTAAFELSRFAADNRLDDLVVDLFERDDRLGGRIRTHYFEGGHFAELGPMRIPDAHKVALHYARQFELAQGTFLSDPNFFCRGEYHHDWRSVMRHVAGRPDPGTPLSRLVHEFARQYRDEDPESLLIRGMEDLGPKQVERLQASRYGIAQDSRLRRFDMFRARPTSKWGLGLDAISVREAFDIVFGQFARNAAASPAEEAQFLQFLWDHAGTLLGLNWVEYISALHFVREGSSLRATAKWRLKGGFTALADAFAKELGKSSHVRLHLGRRVLALRQTERGVEVDVHPAEAVGFASWLGRKPVQHPNEFAPYDRLICAIPTAAVRQMRFEPDLEWDQKTALNGVSYLSACKSAVLYKRRWWELGEGAPPRAGGVTLTDLPNQQVWYPHDNVEDAAHAVVSPAEDEELDFARAGTPALEVRGPYQPAAKAPIPLRGKRRSEAASHGHGAILAAYMWGQNGDRFASLPDSEKDEEIRRCLEQMAPGCSRHELEIVHVAWSVERNPGGGALAWYEPAQHSRYQSVLGRPCFAADGRRNAQITFAGEHLGLIQGWLQGAMQSALYALRVSVQ